MTGPRRLPWRVRAGFSPASPLLRSFDLTLARKWVLGPGQVVNASRWSRTVAPRANANPVKRMLALDCQGCLQSERMVFSEAFERGSMAFAEIAELAGVDARGQNLERLDRI